MSKANKAAQAAAPETSANPAPADEHVGLGGSYEMVDGVRRLVQRTEDAPAQLRRVGADAAQSGNTGSDGGPGQAAVGAAIGAAPALPEVVAATAAPG